MSAGWFAFMDELSGLVSGCRRGGGFCIVGCRGGFEWLVGEYGFWVASCVLSLVWGLRGRGVPGGGMGGACAVCF